MQSLRKVLAAREISALLAFPIWAHREHDKLAGLLCVEQVGGPRQWSTSDDRFVAAVARTASAALEASARLEAQEGARRRAAFLDQTSRTLGGTLEFDEVVRRAAALAVPGLGDGVEIELVEDGLIRRVALDYWTAQGRACLEAAMAERSSERGHEQPYYVVEEVLWHKGSLIVSDFNDLASAQAQLRAPTVVAALCALGTRSLIATPLVVSERIVGVVTFITSARRYGLDDLGLAEEFARRLSAALENAMLHQRVQAAVRARDEFITLAGHELRTPLTALQLSAQELVRRSPTAPREEIERMAGTLVKQISRLDRLSTRMLDATRISAKRFELSRAQVDLAAIARDTTEVYAPLLRRQGCSPLVKTDAPVVGEWDATRLEQVIGMLLDNAAKFCAGKPVEINGPARRRGRDPERARPRPRRPARSPPAHLRAVRARGPAVPLRRPRAGAVHRETDRRSARRLADGG